MSETYNPWDPWTAWATGPRKLDDSGKSATQSITGIDAVDGLIRGYLAVETVKTQTALAKAGAQQAAARTAVEYDQNPGAEPGTSGGSNNAGNSLGFSLDKQTMLMLAGLVGVVLLVR